MPKPCKKPLTPNPFESYRDPVTGQWRVKYVGDVLPDTSPAKEKRASLPVEDPASRNNSLLQHRLEQRHAEKSARNRGVAQQATV